MRKRRRRVADTRRCRLSMAGVWGWGGDGGGMSGQNGRVEWEWTAKDGQRGALRRCDERECDGVSVRRGGGEGRAQRDAHMAERSVPRGARVTRASADTPSGARLQPERDQLEAVTLRGHVALGCWAALSAARAAPSGGALLRPPGGCASRRSPALRAHVARTPAPRRTRNALSSASAASRSAT